MLEFKASGKWRVGLLQALLHQAEVHFASEAGVETLGTWVEEEVSPMGQEDRLPARSQVPIDSLPKPSSFRHDEHCRGKKERKNTHACK
jgi:hypothetical protein